MSSVLVSPNFANFLFDVGLTIVIISALFLGLDIAGFIGKKNLNIEKGTLRQFKQTKAQDNSRYKRRRFAGVVFFIGVILCVLGIYGNGAYF